MNSAGRQSSANRGASRREFPTGFIKTLTILGAASFLSMVWAAADPTNASGPSLIGSRFLTFNTVICVRQIEVTRDTAHGQDESSIHTPRRSPHFPRDHCQGLARRAHHLGVQLARAPQRARIIPRAARSGGVLSQEVRRRDHFHPRRSRQGVGPIETLLDMGTERGLQAMLATTATHFDDGLARNGFAWVTCGWEMSLVEARKIYGYGGRNGMKGLHLWLTEIRKRWPDAKLITQREFGELWRARFKNNDELDYRYVHRGCGIRALEADKEILWLMNKDFRLALLRNWKENMSETVIDFTRYELPAAEPVDPETGNHSRNWSLMNRRSIGMS